MCFHKSFFFRLHKIQFISSSIIFDVVLDLPFPPYPDFFLTYHLYVHLFLCPSLVTTDNGINVVIYGITLKLPTG